MHDCRYAALRFPTTTVRHVLAIVAVLVGIGVPSAAAAQSAGIAGQVLDASGGAIGGAGVTLTLEGAPLGEARSAPDGRFTIASMPPGRYLLVVTADGFAAASQDVTVVASTVAVTVRLSVAGMAETVEVVGTRYRPSTASTGTKLDLPVLQVPQSVSTVTRGLIEDRVLVRLSETADNVAGVRALTGYSGTLGNNYQFRGFSPSLNYTNLRNGFQEYGFLSQRDVANIDRVEFLKGPASLLYGANEVGGLVNTITKQPLPAPRREVGVTVGTFGTMRPTVDLTGPVNASGTLRYRLNAALDRGDSYRDLVDYENTFVAPHLVWQPTPRTTLGVEVEWGRFRNDFDRGFVLAPVFLDEPSDKNFGEPWTDARNRQVNTMVNVAHQITEHWRVRTGFNLIRSNTETNAAGFGFIPLAADGRTINRDNFSTDEFSRNYTSQNELAGRVRTGRVDHQILMGAEVTRAQFNYTFRFKTLAGIDRVNPAYGALPGFSTFGFNDDSVSRQVGLYVQDQIALPGGRSFLLIGGRGSFVESTTRDAVTRVEKNSQTDNAFTPRAGFVYQLTPSTSSYVSLASSFFPNYLPRSRTGEAFTPTSGRQYEVGVKQSLAGDRLLATFAYFDLAKQDVVVPDPADVTFAFSVQVGEERSRGVEAEVTGAVTTNWSIVATYTGINAIVTEDPRAVFVGGRLAGAARHAGSLYTRYAFGGAGLNGLSAGVGVYAAGRRFAALPNPAWTMPSYARVDADVRYDRARWRFNLALKNLTNAQYFELGGFNSMMPQPSRHAMAALHVLF